VLYIGKLHTPTSLHSSKQQWDIVLKLHVISICFMCFKCFIGIL
jgi:hypothetical protein